MRQIRQPQRTSPTPGSPLDDPFAPDDAANMAMITHGPFAESVPIAGLTVGTIRRRFRDRYNLPADSSGMLDGSEVDDDTVITAGQILTFMHRANAKGIDAKKEAEQAKKAAAYAQRMVERRAAKRRERDEADEEAQPTIYIHDEVASVTWPGGRELETPIAAIVAAARPRWFGDTVWQDGVKVVREMSRGAIVVHQSTPRVHNLDWIAADSPADFGEAATYRRVKLALPYVFLVAVFRVARNGKLQLTSGNECFFANAPLSSIDDPMCYPALLNVSKMPEPPQKRPLAWVCSQYLDRSFEKIQDTAERSRRAFGELAHHLFHGGFNRSSENHEGASWFGETVAAGVDDRLGSVEAWEAATATDPVFATEVPWLPTTHTLRQIMDRITGYMSLDGAGRITATDIGRIAVNEDQQSKGKKKEES